MKLKVSTEHFTNIFTPDMLENEQDSRCCLLTVLYRKENNPVVKVEGNQHVHLNITRAYSTWIYSYVCPGFGGTQ